MMVFWIVAALLIAAALLFLVPPLIDKSGKKDVMDRNAINVLLYKDQFKELEADLANGDITQDQYDQAKQDLERSMLQDVSPEDVAINKSVISAAMGSKSAIAVAIIVPLIAISLYNKLGSGEPGLDPMNARVDVQAEGHQGTIEEQVRKLQDHLQSNPDDLEGWVMLARSYYFMKQYQAASDAFGRAVTMTQESEPQLLADYADAMAMANGRSMTGTPFDLVKKAIALDPSHQKALWLAATATYQAQDYQATLGYWNTLLKQFPKGSENYVQMLRNIAEVKQLLGLPIDDILAEIQGGAQAAPASMVGATAAGADTTAAAGNMSVSGEVSLDPALKGRVAATDTVFVFARAAQGPRMPLAILRKQVSDLPITFSLSDADAMNPQMKLSNFPEVVVGARISKSGNAMPQSGDLKGSTSVVKAGAQGLKIIIDSAVP